MKNKTNRVDGLGHDFTHNHDLHPTPPQSNCYTWAGGWDGQHWASELKKRCEELDSLLIRRFAPLPLKLYGMVLKFLNNLHLSKWKTQEKDECKQRLLFQFYKGN